jgi:hypothetical protein
MSKRVFFSFHYAPDNWRVSQIRQMGAIEGDQIVSDNQWESIKRQGDIAIQNWIHEQMKYKQCLVVLIGRDTASRKWVQYEIEKAWNSGKGVVGIHVHNLKDRYAMQSNKGINPFNTLTIGSTQMNRIVKTYDPPYSTSKLVYDHIHNNLESWINEAINIRSNY